MSQVQEVLRRTHLNEGRGARFVDLLLMLVSIDGKPLAKAQNLVFDNMCLGSEDILCSVRFDLQGLPEISGPAASKSWIPLAYFCNISEQVFAKDIWNNSAEEKQFRFYIQCFISDILC